MGARYSQPFNILKLRLNKHFGLKYSSQLNNCNHSYKNIHNITCDISSADSRFYRLDGGLCHENQ